MKRLLSPEEIMIARNTLSQEIPGAAESWLLLNNPKTASAVVGALKRSFSRSPIINEYLRKYRIEKPYIKKDGTVSNVPRIFYKCHKCGNEFPSTKINVDHIEPVVPVNIPVRHMCLSALVTRLYCDESNLQILCKEHHSEKSKEENRQRNEWLVKTKYIVYQTTNRVNNKRYIGVHKCQDYDDKYLGSGTNLKKAITKYGIDKFYRMILFVYDNADEAFEKEEELVTDEIVESRDYYNISTGDREIGVDTSIKVICHQTKEEFSSLSELANHIGVHHTTVCHSIDNPNKPIQNLHYFKKDNYNPEVKVSYPVLGNSIVCLNNRVTYNTILEAAKAVGVNYKSLRNSLVEKDSFGLRSLFDWKFLYPEEYDPLKTYSYEKEFIRCVELDKTFESGAKAAEFLKKKDITISAISINKAIRLKHKTYGYTWERIRVLVNL